MTPVSKPKTTSRNNAYLKTNRPSHLVALAKDFAAINRPSASEISKFRDMFYVLILRTNAHERKKIAEHLSRGYFTPRPVAIYFGMEEIDISAPVLLFSPVLTAYDLNRIIEKNQFKHASIIARRNDLETSTVAILLEVDNAQDNLRSLIKRNSSLNSREDVIGLLSSIQKRVATLKHPEPIHSGSVKIAIKPTEKSTHEKLVRKLAQPKQVETAPIKTNTPKDLSKELLSVARVSKQNHIAKPNREVSASRDGDTLAAQMLTRARAVDLDGLAKLTSQNTGLKTEQALTILTGENAGMQASLFCALGLSKANTSKLLLLLNQKIGRNAEVFKMVMLKFERLTKQECQAFFITMGAEFDNNAVEVNTPLEHQGHFSSAIAERRRNITEKLIPTKQPNYFGKRQNAG